MKSGRRAALVGLILLVVVWVGAGAVPALAADDADSSLSAGLELIADVVRYIRAHHVSEVTLDELIEGAIEGMLSVLGDDYSAYMTPSEYEEFNIDIQGSYSGIGVVITQRGEYIVVVSPFEGSPGQEAGLQPGDRIVSVNGRDIVGMTVEQAARLIRGPAGTTVRLGIERDGTTFEVEIVRREIVLHTVEGRMLEDGIGYIKVALFDQRTASEFGQKLSELKEKGLKGLILDLRDNPGGLLSASVEVAGYLVPPGPVVRVEDRATGRQVFRSDTPALGVPLVVLVNGGTASGAEIVAGAVRDHGVGILVGTRTFGKGSVQSIIDLENGGGLKITTARYLTPAGTALDGRGLEPDVVVEPLPPREEEAEFPAFQFKRELRRGLIGLDVLDLQQRLRALGYDPGPIDGIFGPLTERALRRYQQDRSLQPTGALDEATAATLGRAPDGETEPPSGDRQLDEALAILRDQIR